MQSKETPVTNRSQCCLLLIAHLEYVGDLTQDFPLGNSPDPGLARDSEKLKGDVVGARGAQCLAAAPTQRLLSTEGTPALTIQV